MTTPGGTPGCTHRQCAHPERDRLLTGATLVTWARAAATVVLALAAARAHSLTLLVAALGVYWVLDIVDGAIARMFDQETRMGAVFDVLCDRVSAAAFYVGFAWYRPAMAVPVGIYLSEFMVIDLFLSIAFLAWPVSSPNYFYVVNRRIWRWNWSPIAKVVNGGLFAVLMLVTDNAWLCGVWAAALFLLKCVSVGWLARLRLPVPAGCAIEGHRVASTP
jgi:CDP-diacylglycerol---glycerol-3-phosphate 3-phosphatidyltransferase